MVAAILHEVHEVRRKIFEEAGNDLHVLFQRLREAEKKHPERAVELPHCTLIDARPRIIPYAGEANEGPSEESRTKGAPQTGTPCHL